MLLLVLEGCESPVNADIISPLMNSFLQPLEMISRRTKMATPPALAFQSIFVLPPEDYHFRESEVS